MKHKSQRPHSGRTANHVEQAATRELLTDEQAAAYVGGITARAVRDWRTKRGLPFIRITSKVNRIRKSDLDQWLARLQAAITRKGS